MEIELIELHKSFHDAVRELTVIESLSAKLPSKGSLAIVGESGVGKSTLLHLMGGLISPTSGKILISGTDISSLSGDALSGFRGRHIGFVFQFHHLLPEFSALENVSLPLIIGGTGDKEARERAEALLEKVGLKERISHRPGELSGGEQQRVAIARAVVGNPDLILADEPTGNLDEKTSQRIEELLLEINSEIESLLIVVTHSRKLASAMDSAVEMHFGGEIEEV